MKNRHSPGVSGTPAPRRKIVYRPEDTVDLRYGTDLGDPGEFPFTRGVYPEMYRGRLWTIRQYAGFASAAESNQRYRFLLSQGITGLSVAFDLPTQLGLDSDHPLAGGEVGRVGVAIDSLEDMERLFEGIPLGEVSTSMTINATAPILLALYLAVARRQGVDWARLRGTIQNDILKEYAARGTYIFPPGPSLRIITDIFAFCCDQLPSWNTISISGYHIREAGATAGQELAFTMANAEAYAQAAVQRGLPIDRVAPQMSFFFSAHNDLFEEIAKFRAARKIWAALMRDRFGAQSERTMQMRFHVQTAGSTLMAQQPSNNIIRVALQALAAVLGGAQSLHTNAFDEALALPTPDSARLALRTQQILAFESGVASTADPVGGSWYLERLTRDLEMEANEYLKRIRSMGGVLRALQDGYVQGEIQRSAFEQQRRLEQGTDRVVGLNCFIEGEAPPVEITRIDPEVETLQCERLSHLKRDRDAGQVRACLQAVRAAASSGENLMPPILAAVEQRATVGELSDALRDVFGEYQEKVVI